MNCKQKMKLAASKSNLLDEHTKIHNAGAAFLRSEKWKPK